MKVNNSSKLYSTHNYDDEYVLTVQVNEEKGTVTFAVTAAEEP